MNFSQILRYLFPVNLEIIHYICLESCHGFSENENNPSVYNEEEK